MLIRLWNLRTWLFVVVPVLICGALVAGGLALAGSASATPSSALPAHYAAPYLQIGSSDAGDMAADEAATGLKYYTLAFLTPQSGCTAVWEDDGSAVGAFASQISALQAAGGDVIVSFGGAEGGELAQTCTDVSQLTAAYLNVVDTYGITRLDFDIEGSVLSDTAATTLRDQALAALQAQDPSVQVDFTLAVDPTGLPTGSGSEYALLQDAQTQGVKVSIVNLMTMDFGDGQDALTDAESAAQAAAGQLASLYGISTSAAYGMEGLTPIAGQNDDDENFSTEDAQTLESFAASNGVGELSFWEIDEYDKATGYQYSSIFNQIAGGSGAGPSPSTSTSPGVAGTGGESSLSPSLSTGGSAGASPSAGPSAVGSAGPSASVGGSTTPSAGGSAGTDPGEDPSPSTASSGGTTSANGQITGYQGLCLDDRSSSTVDLNPVQVYVCNGSSAQQWTVGSNGTEQALGKCLDVDASGTANGTKVDLYDCNGTGAQVWVHRSDGELMNPQSRKCLDDTGWGGSGTQVQIWACADTSNQQWSTL
jgi:chitinase